MKVKDKGRLSCIVKVASNNYWGYGCTCEDLSEGKLLVPATSTRLIIQDAKWQCPFSVLRECTIAVYDQYSARLVLLFILDHPLYGNGCILYVTIVFCLCLLLYCTLT